MYIRHVINPNIYYRELNKKIFDQFTIVDHNTTPLMKFDPLTFKMEVNTPTIKPPHLLQ
jgi:hypothetical protein